MPPESWKVFPAYAGMFRSLPTRQPLRACFPRIRGDVPLIGTDEAASELFSPHTRGCSFRPMSDNYDIMVFPAYAGMFPAGAKLGGLNGGFPRIRGDVPPRMLGIVLAGVFSPHTRGCSQAPQLNTSQDQVFPAYAGMFRSRRCGRCLLRGFPRIRGDVPNCSSSSASLIEFSPHTRGCSLDSTREQLDQLVFPAYAGMFRILRPCYRPWRRFPRIRGDVPCSCHETPLESLFSPHTRGCSHVCHLQ